MQDARSRTLTRMTGVLAVSAGLMLSFAGVSLAEPTPPPKPPPSAGSTGTKGGVYGDGSKVYRAISCPLAYELFFKDSDPSPIKAPKC